MRGRQASQGRSIIGGRCQVGWMGGYQWLRLSVGRPLWQIGLVFRRHDRSREAGESWRDLRRLGLQVGRVKFAPDGYRSVY